MGILRWGADFLYFFLLGVVVILRLSHTFVPCSKSHTHPHPPQTLYKSMNEAKYFRARVSKRKSILLALFNHAKDFVKFVKNFNSQIQFTISHVPLFA